MPTGEVSLKLPPSSLVSVQGYANSANLQRVTISRDGAQPVVFEGAGHDDTPIGDAAIQAPPNGELITLTVESSLDGGGTWRASQVDMTECQIMYYALAVIVSEDSSEDTWRSATTYVSWTQPPSR
jgi:Fucose-binding lectin II (PA-IIL)